MYFQAQVRSPITHCVCLHTQKGTNWPCWSQGNHNCPRILVQPLFALWKANFQSREKEIGLRSWISLRPPLTWLWVWLRWPGRCCSWLWKFFPQPLLALPTLAWHLKAEGGGGCSLWILPLLASRRDTVSFSPKRRHLCQEIWGDIYLPETHTDLSATDEDKGIMSRKGKESGHLEGHAVHSWGHASFPTLDAKGQLIPHSRWGRGVGSPAVHMGKGIRRPEFKSQPGYFSASDFSELQLPST